VTKVTSFGLDDIRRAAQVLEGVAVRTPVLTSPVLDDLAGGRVFLKCENLQRAGSFKFRGAYNKLLSVPEEERAAGVCAISSGNHTQAVAYAAQILGIKAVILMPEDAPPEKLEATQAYGAEVVTYDRYSMPQSEAGKRLREETGLTFISSHDDPMISAGAGTAALELIDEVPALEYLFAPIGGGGGMAGYATVMKELRPDSVVIGAEPSASGIAKHSLDSGERVSIPVPKTIADGQQLTTLGEFPFGVMRGRVDSVFEVDDARIIDAMRLLFERVKIVVEPSGAIALAALIERGDLGGRSAGVILSGGSISIERLHSYLQLNNSSVDATAVDSKSDSEAMTTAAGPPTVTAESPIPSDAAPTSRLRRRRRGPVRAIGRVVFWIFLVFVVTLPLTAPLVARSLKQRGAAPAIEPRPAKVIRGDISQSFNTNGSVVPERTGSVRSPATGKVSEIRVQEGAKVTAGQAIIVVRAADPLGGTGRTFQAEAPFDGIVSQIRVELNGPASAELPIAVVESEKLVVEAQVPPARLGDISTAPEAIEGVSGRKPFACPFIESRRRSAGAAPQGTDQVPVPLQYTLRCGVPAELGLVVGTPVDLVVITRTAKGVLLVPRAAITTRGSEPYVTRVSGPRREQVKVTLGIENERQVEVVSGLSEGDTILDFAPAGPEVQFNTEFGGSSSSN
jgi:threonine dehydratase/multidrug efflux pump subunit AcrA (membrane-fusion protein)